MLKTMKRMLGFLGGLSLFSGLSLAMTSCVYGPPVCYEGETQCDGNDLIVCNPDGMLVVAKTCDSCSNDPVPHCENLVALYGPQPCEEGTSWCQDNVVFTCENYTPKPKLSCTQKAPCIQEGNSAHCKPEYNAPTPLYGMPVCETNEARCENNAIYACKNGKDTLLDTCDENEYCESDPIPHCAEIPPIMLYGPPPAACEKGSAWCEGKNVKFCKNGEIVTWECEDECTEIDENTITCQLSDPPAIYGPPPAACEEGTFWCEEDVLKKCKNGQIETLVCQFGCIDLEEGGAICGQPVAIYGPPPAACEEGTSWCEDEVLKKCINGEIKTKNCQFGCVDLEEGTAVCDKNIALYGPPSIPSE